MNPSEVSGCQVAALEERLKELEGERAELVKFQQVDKQRRSLEYTIYDNEITEARQALEQARRPPLPACCLVAWLEHHGQNGSVHLAWDRLNVRQIQCRGMMQLKGPSSTTSPRNWPKGMAYCAVSWCGASFKNECSIVTDQESSSASVAADPGL